ncbi:M3 family oligoendopeptidase [Paludisphaera rhizosphaerae]|uniref:M3 family oligoendopeptidase n=1 Tax=Paludisphaera rhizosphaerae TaxID=2711216 RepID=UPI0013EA92A6|nr:M3 family oligoendopeptidase [Paludisphaera rhizosphaerae]
MTTTYVPEKFPPRWLPEGTELKTWEQIEPWYQKLLALPVDTPEQVETWLAASDELNAAVGQEGTARYVAMTCQTDDPAREASYLEFVREVEPKLKPYLNDVRNRFLDAPGRAGLSKDRYHVFVRSLENRRALYREANIPRETRLAELQQSYQKAVGAMTVQFQGQERTLAQLSPFLESPDRNVRREAWTLAAERRLTDRDMLDGLFDEMRALRLEIAREAGFDDYVAYSYRNRERFDYGPTEAYAFHEAVEKTVVPLAAEIHREHRKSLGVDSLRPWDLSADSLGRPPLKPYDDVARLAVGAEEIFREVDPDLGAQFAYMREHNLLDLANRKGKAPGGYQTTYEADRLPFIFMNAVGVDGDVRTLLHEGGHAFHTLASRGEKLAAYRESPLEFCEVASMTMELFGAGAKDPFYAPAESERSYRKLLEGIVTILPWIATVDAFQHWLYNNPEHTRDDRRAAWRGLIERFGGDVDWSGLEDARDHSWHRQLHIFLYPFYYIEYGIAQLGALQLWKRSLTDRPGAVASYRKALSIGGARPLPQLFEAAGARFAFDVPTIAPLMETIGQELSRLAP